MCEQCLKEDYPDRGSICLETGTYLSNLKKCINCGRKDNLTIANRQSNDSEFDVEIILYEHRCSCDHLIAEHEYKFWVEDGFQYYEMHCGLCGDSEDSRSCLPDDPRQELC